MPIDLSTSATKTYFVGTLVGIAHIALGIAALVEPASWRVTHLASLHDVVSYSGYGPEAAGFVLLFAGVTAVFGATNGLRLGRWLRASFFIPQEVLLLLQIWSIIVAVVTGAYPDNYIPVGGAWFIMADQVQALILALSHSFWLALLLYKGGASGLHKTS
jgi:hypothetical protein